MKKFLLVFVAGVTITVGGNAFFNQYVGEAEHPDPTSIQFAGEAEHPDPTSIKFAGEAEHPDPTSYSQQA